jgi:hypothetical protein
MPRLTDLLRRMTGRKQSESSAEIDVLPDHESGVRRLMADARSEPYEALRSLAAAQSVEDGVVVMEGDYGGQIYLVCPACLVSCDESVLEQLLADLDAHEWNDSEGARVFYERRAVGAGVAGGMGGGTVVEGVWLHDELRKLGLEPAVLDVIANRRERIGER